MHTGLQIIVLNPQCKQLFLMAIEAMDILESLEFPHMMDKKLTIRFRFF